MTAPQPQPTLNYVSPSYGPAGGGTIVTLGGTGLRGVTAVLFGETEAAGVTSVDDDRVICVAPPGPADTAVHVTAVHAAAENNTGQLTAAAAYTYVGSGPGGE